MVSGMHMVGTGKAVGSYAVAMASGTANNPSRIVLALSATPSQSALVSWDLDCTENGGGVGSKSGQVTLRLPVVEPLIMPAPSSSCIVSGDVQLTGTGTLVITIESTSK
jgi:hypothetical protein